MKFGIIGGSGFYELEGERKSRLVSTHYGDVHLDILSIGDTEVAFLPRHGKEHTIAPHKINYRANIAALKDVGIQNVLVTAAVGSLNPDYGPGELVLPTQFLDFTWGRESTFFDEGDVHHTDFSEPYCPNLRRHLLHCAGEMNIKLHNDSTYVCTQGPRFETPAEIKMFDTLGGDLVGMTGVPEAVLAREAGLCYATVALVTNWAAGLRGKPLAHEEFSGLAKEKIAVIRDLFFTAIKSYDITGCSNCRIKE